MTIDRHPRLDKKDLALLRLLRLNGNRTHDELAEMVSLSRSPCSTRIRQLEKCGLIVGYQAILSPLAKELIGETEGEASGGVEMRVG